MMSISIVIHQASINRTAAPETQRTSRKKSPTLIARSLCLWASESCDRDRALNGNKAQKNGLAGLRKLIGQNGQIEPTSQSSYQVPQTYPAPVSHHTSYTPQREVVVHNHHHYPTTTTEKPYQVPKQTFAQTFEPVPPVKYSPTPEKYTPVKYTVTTTTVKPTYQPSISYNLTPDKKKYSPVPVPASVPAPAPLPVNNDAIRNQIALENEIDQYFRTFDVNHDNSISRSEFSTMMKILVKQTKQPTSDGSGILQPRDI